MPNVTVAMMTVWLRGRVDFIRLLGSSIRRIGREWQNTDEFSTFGVGLRESLNERQAERCSKSVRGVNCLFLQLHPSAVRSSVRATAFIDGVREWHWDNRGYTSSSMAPAKIGWNLRITGDYEDADWTCIGLQDCPERSV